MAGYSQDPPRTQWDSWYQNTYLKAIEKYKGTQYYQQLLDNPYAQYQDAGRSTISTLFDPNNGFGSRLLNGLTFGLGSAIGDAIDNSAQSRLDSDRQQTAMEELSRIEGLMQQNNYNSSASQVARDIAAGLNPDIVGASGGAPAADNPGVNETDSPASPNDVMADAMASVQGIGSMASNFLTGCMNMMSFFQDFESKSIANAAGDIGLLDTVYNTALKQAAGMSGLPSTLEDYQKLSEEEKLGADQAVYDTLTASIKEGTLGSMVLNRRAKSMLKKMTGRVMYDKEGKPTLAFQQQRAAMLKSFYGDTLDAGKSAGHPVMSNPEDFASVMELCMKFFGDYEDAVMKFNKKVLTYRERTAEAQARTAEAGAASAEAQSSYDVGMYSEDLGKAEGEARRLEAEQRQLDTSLDSMMQEAMDGLEQYGISGKVAKVGLLAIRQALKSLVMSVSPFAGSKNKALRSMELSY